MLLAQGTSIGPYTIVEPVGSGGMGVVYRAHDTRLSRDVAIKVVSGEIAARPEARLRFEQEARAVAALSHPNIVAIHDVGAIEGVPFAVTELLEGESLRARIARGPLPWREAAVLALAMADGLAAAHARAIVHRDIKPENLFLTTDGRLKILDFGLARTMPRVGAGGDSGDQTALATEAGIVLGTIGYLSPEQARGEAAGPPSDVFAVGCVIYEMITGRRAFDGPTGADRLAAVLHAVPTRMTALVPGVPPPFAAIVDRALEKPPERRYRDARALADALRAIVADSGRTPAVARTRGRGRAGKALAVLPFELDPPEPDGAFLSDGLTEAIINSLTALPKLRVVPRSTVFRYRGRLTDLAAVGRELDVARVLVGHLTRRGDLLKLQVELIDPARDTQLWGQQYTRALTDIFALQDELARDVTTALRVRLSPPARQRLTQRHCCDSDAYQDYLRGRHHLARYSPEGFQKAIGCFEAAIARDPGYAAAHAELGDAIGTARFFGYIMPDDGETRARAAIVRALEIDPQSPEAHAARGKMALFFERDFATAASAFQEALRLKPEYPECRMFSAYLQLVLGHGDRALEEARAAVDMAPLEPLLNAGLAMLYLLGGHSEAAIVQARRTISLEPGFLLAHNALVFANMELGRLDEAIDWFAPVALAVGLTTDASDRLREALRSDGAPGFSREWLRLLEETAARRYVPPHLFLYAQAKLGNHDQALVWAERCAAINAGMLIFLGVDPCIRDLRRDPRFVALLERLGLPAILHDPARTAAVGQPG
jgi:non-specific serine/threonine protein kinase